MLELRKTRELVSTAVTMHLTNSTWKTENLYLKLLHNLQSIYNKAIKIEDDVLKKKMTDRFAGYLCRSLRNVLLQMLEKMLTEEVAAESFERFFNFTVECVKRNFFPKRDILDLFDDLYECCPESKL
jgi:hypothetical protein